jgi:hypothetical protein
VKPDLAVEGGEARGHSSASRPQLVRNFSAGLERARFGVAFRSGAHQRSTSLGGRSVSARSRTSRETRSWCRTAQAVLSVAAPDDAHEVALQALQHRAAIDAAQILDLRTRERLTARDSASVSSAARESRTFRSGFAARITCAYSGRVRNCQPAAISAIS